MQPLTEEEYRAMRAEWEVDADLLDTLGAVWESHELLRKKVKSLKHEILILMRGEQVV